MKTIGAIAGAVAILSGTTGSAMANCTLFQHRDYGGSRHHLVDLETLKMVRGESTGCSVSHGDPRCPFTTYDPTWNDHVSSFKVGPGCTLTLWQHVNKGGARWRTSKSYRYVGGRWNDQASEAFCSC
jgi:hypothetical protein